MVLGDFPFQSRPSLIILADMLSNDDSSPKILPLPISAGRSMTRIGFDL